MKKFIIAIATLAFALCGCSHYLDKEVDLSLDSDQVFSQFNNTRGFLANLYTYLPDSFSGFGDGQYLGAFRDCMTDNMVSFWDVHRYHSVQTDSYDSKNHYFALNYWPKDYRGIRAANQFMASARPDVVGNDPLPGSDDDHLYNRYVAEARFIRALLHFDLVFWFGGVPIVGDDEEGKPLLYEITDYEQMNRPQSTPAEVLQWIANECDAIKDVLPFRYANEDENWGRANGAAAYALKSRALLYKASALNNPSNDQSWWRAAAQAADDFIAKNNANANPYTLYATGNPESDYYNCFVTTPHLNNEYIFSRSEYNTSVLETDCSPCGFSGSSNAVGRSNPTQNLVDCYETINGLPIDEDPTYDDQNPFVNRDPRLAQTVFYHGMTWGIAEEGEERQLDMRFGFGRDYQELHGGTLTGYYVKKYIRNVSWKSMTSGRRACPIFRYAEILMNAAEAYCEIGELDKAASYVNQVRARAGMPAYNGSAMGQDRLRERIYNEDRIEFCFEDHRWGDERRWKLFDKQTMNGELSLPIYKQIYHMYRIQINTDPDTQEVTNYTYPPAEKYPVRSFLSPKNYYFPIPDSEVKKTPELKQNKGWEVAD